LRHQARNIALALRMSGVQMPVSEAGWIENKPSRGFRPLDIRELLAYRELAAFLAFRDIQVRYKQAIFGVGWAVLQPLATAALFAVVFGRLAGMPSDGLPYPLFAYVGSAVWTYFSGAVTKATQMLVQNAALVTKVYFPRVLVPVAAVLPGLVDLLVSLCLLAVLFPLYGRQPGWPLLTAPLWLAPLVTAALGAGLWLGTLNVSYRDVNQGVSLVVQLWLFASPVAYPSSVVPDSWRLAYFLNPAAGPIEGLRWALLGAPWPGSGPLLVSLVTGLGLLTGGLLYFLRVERRFADVI
jgi:lipopolysaccharide transport system permease protein